MDRHEFRVKTFRMNDDFRQNGSAIVIALFVLALIGVFVALALSRSSAEAYAVGNEAAEARAVYAAQGSLEMMTRNFNKVFEVQLNPSLANITAIENEPVPGMDDRVPGPYMLGPYDFLQEVLQTSDSTTTVLNGGPYTGLIAFQDNWRLRTTATDVNGTQVQLTRNILNNRIPIFQFGIFYNDDLELFRPPRFSFGGRVHSNGNFFVSPGPAGVYFDSRVTAAGHIVTQSWRNWFTGDSANNQTFIKNASDEFKQLLPTSGSVLNTTAGNSNNVFEFPPALPSPTPTPNVDLPPSRLNPGWDASKADFDGNLQNLVTPLRLPLNVGANTDLIEMVRRGKEIANPAGGDLYSNNDVLTPVTVADNGILRAERFANKTGIRISLADSKAKLPGCASGTGTAAIAGPCGVRLDGNAAGTGAALAGEARGYQPKSMRSVAAGPYNYIPTRVNGDRLFTGNPREVWIKVETVRTDPTTFAIITADITEDVLSLGVTEQFPAASGFSIDGYNSAPPDNRTDLPTRNINLTNAQTASTGTDSRSVVKIQRFAIPGAPIPGPTPSANAAVEQPAATRWVYRINNYNFVSRYRGRPVNIDAGCPAIAPAPAPAGSCSIVNDDPNGSSERLAHLKKLNYGDPVYRAAIVPFPIKMFDIREGFYYDARNTTWYSSLSNLPRNGVMSMIDIDVANLRRFLRGDYNGLFPNGAAPNNTPFSTAKGSGLESSWVPRNPSDIWQREGWVLYVSDRRGDADFDGQFDMEDIYHTAGATDNTLQPGEDLDPPGAFGFGVLNTSYGLEAERYNTNALTPDQLAVNDHRYYRRGVRLINGTTVPGVYDSAVPSNTRGFTVSSENGIYVQGNYNATNANPPPTTGPSAGGNTPFDEYFPKDTPTHIPASIVADAVTILSNAWNDAQSFWSPVTAPYNQTNRIASETHMRFAMISGDTIATRDGTPNQGGISPKLNGGVHNFKRFLERWTGTRLNYAGSLINLYNSHNNNGSFKCCNTVYNPPDRNWVFDRTFLDPARLPPGTPYFQYVQTTGFQRTNN